MVELLLDRGADVNASDERGWRAPWGVRAGESPGSDTPLGPGRRSDARDKYDCTALNLASSFGTVEIVKLLCGEGSRC